MSYRDPPKPEHYDSAQPGQCRYCGGDIFTPTGKLNKRANWHPDCVKQYKQIYWVAETRRAVWARDKGQCAHCTYRCTRKDWEMDHIRPLIEAKGDINFWKLPNLQLLCKDCHRAKTSAEATSRAAARAAQKAQMGTSGTPPKKGRTKPRNRPL